MFRTISISMSGLLAPARRTAVRMASTGIAGAAARRSASLASTGTRQLSGLPSYKHGKHRSNAQAYIADTDVIVVDDTVAVCDGGSGALGHPVEYIQLDTVSKKPAVCKYCGLKFKMGTPHHH